jgi:NitT/TauT family transport system substrate-binding protein
MALVGPKNFDEYLGSQEVTYVASWDTGSLVANLAHGEFDIAIIPPNVAAMSVAGGGRLRIAAVNSVGGYYVVSKGVTITGVEDLAGKTVNSGGPGETPNVLMDVIMDNYGLTDKVEVRYAPYPDDLVPGLAALDDDVIVVLPEPYVSDLLALNPSYSIAIDLAAEFEKITGVPVVSTVTVINKDFDASHPRVVEAFLEASQRSSQYLHDSPAEAAQILVDNGVTQTTQGVVDGLPRSGVSFMRGQEAKSLTLQYLSALYVYNPEMLGNAPPGDTLFPQ